MPPKRKTIGYKRPKKKRAAAPKQTRGPARPSTLVQPHATTKRSHVETSDGKDSPQSKQKRDEKALARENSDDLPNKEHAICNPVVKLFCCLDSLDVRP